MYKSLIYLIALICLNTACNSKNQVEKSNPAPVKQQVPPLPEQELRALVFNCTSIEYTFRVLPITLSVSKDEGLEANIVFASLESPTYDPSPCKSMARKIFNVGTETYLEAEVFLSEKCHHYDFYKDGKLVYRSQISEKGVNFYKSIIQQATGQGTNQ